MKIIYVWLLTATLFLGGCAGVNFDWDDARQVSIGMSQDEVITIMGNPSHISSYGDGTTLYQWVFATGFGSVKQFTVKFDDTGKAISVPAVPESF